MHILKKLVVSLGVVILFVSPSFADILEDLDNLTPEQALEFQKKLKDKSIEAKMKDSNFGIFVQRISPSKFNDAFSYIRNIDAVYGFEFVGRKPVGHNLYLGGKGTFAGTYATRDTSPNVYEDLILGYGAFQAVLEYRIIQNDLFVLSTNAGGGFLVGGYKYSKTDENTQSDFDTYRVGANWCASAAVDASVVIEDGWSVGLGVGYFSGKIDSLQRVFHSRDGNSPELDLSGMTVKLSVSKYF